jgi:hypothetical protein
MANKERGGAPLLTETLAVEVSHMMMPPTPIMRAECFLERLDDDSDDEFNYDFIDDGGGW